MEEEDLDLSELIYKWIKQGDIHELRKYLQEVSNPDEVLYSSLLYNYSPLHWAVKREREDMTRLLLQYGCDIEAYVSPLKMAVEVNNSSLFTALCECGANSTSTSTLRIPFLSHAASKSVETFKSVLLQPGLQLTSPNGCALYSLFDVYSQCGDIYNESNQQHLEDFKRKFGWLCSRTSVRRLHRTAYYCISMGYYCILYVIYKEFPEIVQSMSDTKRQKVVAKLTARQPNHQALLCTKKYVPLIVLELNTSLPEVCAVADSRPVLCREASACIAVEESSSTSGDESDTALSANRAKAFLPSSGSVSITTPGVPTTFDKVPIFMSDDSNSE